MSGPRITHTRHTAIGRGSRTTTPDPNKPRFSAFFVLLNTNKAPRTDAEANLWGRDLQDALGAVIDHEWRDVIKFRDGVTQNGRIDAIRVNSAPEIGPKFGKLHLHALIEIDHRVQGGGIHLRPRALKEAVRRRGNTAAVRALPAIWVRGFTSQAALHHYIAKGLHTNLDLSQFSGPGS